METKTTAKKHKHNLTFKRSYGANVKGGNIIELQCECGKRVKTNGFTGKVIRER